MKNHHPDRGYIIRLSATMTVMLGLMLSINIYEVVAQTPRQEVQMRIMAQTAGTNGPMTVRSDSGSLRTLTVVGGQIFRITLQSVGASACQMNSPFVGGVPTNWTSEGNPGERLYPAPGGKTIIKFACTNMVQSAQDSVVISRQ
ncbi:MAG: hypothetical protein AAB660_01545 [Patescibacteria group bacterium]